MVDDAHVVATAAGSFAYEAPTVAAAAYITRDKEIDREIYR